MNGSGRRLLGRHRALPAVEAASQPEQDATAALMDEMDSLAADATAARLFEVEAELDATITRLHALEQEYTRFVAAVLHNAPQEWGDITPATALRYLRHLEIEVGRLGGRDLPSRCYPPVAETTPIGDAAASALAAAKAATQTAPPGTAHGTESPQALAVVQKSGAGPGGAESASPAAGGEGDGGSAPVAAAPGKPAKAAGLAQTDSGPAPEGGAGPESPDEPVNDCAERGDER